jgi:hypothetical protein
MEKSLLDLIKRACTLDQLKDFLRPYKEVDSDEVRISGTKEDLLAVINRCVAKDIFTEDALSVLLGNAEENGNQHIFFYTPRRKSDQKLYREGDAFAKKLFGARWRTNMGFPQAKLVPDEFTWADFRIGDKSGRPNDWLGKIYGLSYHRTKTGEEKIDTREYAVYYKEEPERIVCVVRWNNPDLLEIRISRSQWTTAKTISNRLDKVWSMIQPAIQRGNFVDWTLENARFQMVETYAHNEIDDYDLGDTQFIDSESGTALFSPYDPIGGSLFAAAERKEAIELFLQQQAACGLCQVRWKTEADQKRKDWIRTQIGGFRQNEITVFPRVLSEELDYVTERLRQFNNAGA